MSRASRIALVVVLGAVGFCISQLVDPGHVSADLAVLAAALAAGELLELRPSDRRALPLSFAVVVVLLRAGSPSQILVTMSAAFAVGVALRTDLTSPIRRAALLVERVAAGAAAVIVYRLIVESTSTGPSRGTVLGALAAAALMPILVSDAVGFARVHVIVSWRARGADLALVASGILMAVGYRGIGDDGKFGLWGSLLFAVPLLAAWYSFELVASTRRSFRETVRALGAAPELGELVRQGHVDHVAELAVAMGRKLGVSGADLEDLETAALLHHLGAVCLDEPEAGEPLAVADVARFGAEMLRSSEELERAGDIIAAEPRWHRPPGADGPPAATLCGQILKVASAYDELTEGSDEHAVWAIEALYTGPGYVYDGRVLGALERVLEARGALRDRV